MSERDVSRPHQTIPPEAYVDWLSRPLHPIHETLNQHLPKSGVALELGCGVGVGVIDLLNRGLSVVAVDSDEKILDFVRSRVPDNANITFIHGLMEEVEIPQCDVIVAGFSLFFVPPNAFDALWSKLVKALNPGGLFAGQFLGVHDDWNDPEFTLHDRSKVEKLLVPFELLSFEEIDRPGKVLGKGSKHWHVFHVVARKKQG